MNYSFVQSRPQSLIRQSFKIHKDWHISDYGVNIVKN